MARIYIMFAFTVIITLFTGMFVNELYKEYQLEHVKEKNKTLVDKIKENILFSFKKQEEKTFIKFILSKFTKKEKNITFFQKISMYIPEIDLGFNIGINSYNRINNKNTLNGQHIISFNWNFDNM